MPQPHVPSYRLHRPSGQAVVTLGGRDYYLGEHGSARSRQRYDQLLSQWLATRQAPPRPRCRDESAVITVNLVLAAYLRHARVKHEKAGEPTGQLPRVLRAIHFARTHCGDLPALDFTAQVLRGLRAKLVAQQYARSYINALIGILQTAYDWAAGDGGLLPGRAAHELRGLRGLKKGVVVDGRKVCEAPPVRAVALPVVNRTLDQLARIPRAMAELQHLTAMRPCEVCGVRPENISRNGICPSGQQLTGVWVYEVQEAWNKNAHHGQPRWVLIGPRGQQVLTPFLDRSPTAYCFSPAEAVAEWLRAAGRAEKVGRGREPGECYVTESYEQAIANAVRRARRQLARELLDTGLSARDAWARLRIELPRWTPNQLRHLRATELRSRYDLDTAQIVLGHAAAGVTGIYAEADLQKAARAMREIG